MSDLNCFRLCAAQAVSGVAAFLLLSAAAPGAIAAPDNDRVQLNGTLIAVHADDFKHGRVSFRYYLRTGGKRVRLHLRGDQSASLGARVAVSGELTGSGAVSVDRLSPLGAASPRIAGPGERKVAVILFDFANNQNHQFTPSEVRDQIFADANSPNAYYQEESSAAVSFTGIDDPGGDVFGWYSISRSDSPCDYFEWEAEASSLAQADGVDVNAYDNVLFVSPYTTACPYAGIANMPGDAAHINVQATEFLQFVVTHELAHNFGVHHSSSLWCAGGPIPFGLDPGSCSLAEYGDPYDVMGAYNGFQHNNVHKANLDFLTGTAATIAASGTYVLKPSEPGFGGNQLLRVKRAPSLPTNLYNYLYLDFRQPHGIFDDFSPLSPQATGVTVRVGPDLGIPLQTRLIDATPATPSDFLDSPLPVGGSFTDSASGIQVSTVSAGPTEAQVSITGMAGEVSVVGGELRYRSLASAGADVSVSHPGSVYRVSDRGVPSIGAGAGCSPTADPQEVTCADAGVSTGSISATDAADHVAVDASVPFTIKTGDGADVINSGAGNDSIESGAGSDAIAGGAGDDVILADVGDNTINGGAGNDVLSGGLDADTFAGGPDFDTVTYADRSTRIKADIDGKSDDGRPGEGDTVQTDIEGVVGGCGNDTLTGNGNANTLIGSCGNDTIYGAPIASSPDVGDTILGGLGVDTLYGRQGDDFIDGNEDNDKIRGEKGNDRLRGGAGTNTVVGYDGADEFRSIAAGEDRMLGGSGDDIFFAHDGGGDDRLSCSSGHADSGDADLNDSVSSTCEAVNKLP